MEFFTKSNIEFMKYRGFFVVLSLSLLAIAFAELFFMTGINLGIDFKGGTQLTIKLRETVDVDDLRNMLQSAGQREAQIQRYGGAEDREFLIKAPVVAGSEEGSADAIIAALDSDLNSDLGGKVDLNRQGRAAVTQLFLTEDPDAVVDIEGDGGIGHYEAIASAIMEQRRQNKMFSAWDEVRVSEGLSEAAFATLQEKAALGAFHVLQNDNVGPQIGSELATKGILAMVLSFLGMLAYIWYRFELRFGVGALVAVFHDFLITLGLYALLNYEFNLPTIAAFLTLVGYSVNDTVVIFDRVRENMARHRRMELVDLINLSLNQTLSRTILTSGTTLLVVCCLFFLGGEVLRGFAFVLMVGVVIGTYSSIFVASPFTLLWEKYFGADKVRTKKAASRTA
jgi:preprotein translocase subunit SecF